MSLFDRKSKKKNRMETDRYSSNVVQILSMTD